MLYPLFAHTICHWRTNEGVLKRYFAQFHRKGREVWRCIAHHPIWNLGFVIAEKWSHIVPEKLHRWQHMRKFHRGPINQKNFF